MNWDKITKGKRPTCPECREIDRVERRAAKLIEKGEYYLDP